MNLATLLALSLLQDPSPEGKDLMEMNLEDLINVDVTSVSKREQRLIDAPSAITVIRGDEIRRSGYRHIADALRLVPGMNVASINGSTWAVSSRGFPSRYANKMEVLVDGRQAYSPIFSGVFWESTDVNLDEIDRIEVIRGPGATLWGSNAVNGVVNVITKPATRSQGGYLEAGGGTFHRGFGEARYGFTSGDVSMRLTGRTFEHGETEGGEDAWHMSRLGTRLDWKAGEQDRVILSGEYFNGRLEGLLSLPTLLPPYVTLVDNQTYFAGGHGLFRWERTLSDTASLSFQASYEKTRRDDEWIHLDADTVTSDLQGRFRTFWDQDFVWGLGYRYTAYEFGNTEALAFDPERRDENFFSAFLQDELPLGTPDLRLTIGTKVERNVHTGWEVQPGARLAWKPHDRHLFWASYARAVRMPSPADEDVTAQVRAQDAGGPTLLTLFQGSRDVVSEDLDAFEFGYRLQPADQVFVDFACFYNRYDHFRGSIPGTPGLVATPIPHLELPVTANNGLDVETSGFELEAQWMPADWIRLRAWYSLLLIRSDVDSSGTVDEPLRRQSPGQQVHASASLNLPGGVLLDLQGRYVGGMSDYNIPSYIECDARLAWRAGERIEVSLVGLNLLASDHREFGVTGDATVASELERSFYLAVSVRF